MSTRCEGATDGCPEISRHPRAMSRRLGTALLSVLPGRPDQQPSPGPLASGSAEGKILFFRRIVKSQHAEVNQVTFGGLRREPAAHLGRLSHPPHEQPWRECWLFGARRTD